MFVRTVWYLSPLSLSLLFVKAKLLSLFLSLEFRLFVCIPAKVCETKAGYAFNEKLLMGMGLFFEDLFFYGVFSLKTGFLPLQP